MLLKSMKNPAVVLTPILLFALIFTIYYTTIRVSRIPSVSDGVGSQDAFYSLTEDEDDSSYTQEPEISSSPSSSPSSSIKENTLSVIQTHNEIFSVSHPSGKYFPISFGEEAMNPSILPHPSLADTYIVVAQQGRTNLPEESVFYSELSCNARFRADGKLVCVSPAKNLPIAATQSGDKCVGGIGYFALNVGPHDARVFYGPEAPYVMYGSNSWWTCFGLWMQDLRMLMDWAGLESEPYAVERYRLGTELQRPSPVGLIEKNWFLFWDGWGDMYVHYDVFPKRVFARLGDDGSVKEDLAPLAALNDEKCLTRFMPTVAPQLESIHQATNSLSVTLCSRSDPACKVDDSNTYILTIFQHKSFYNFHSVYEPYAMLFKRAAPFELFGLSTKPIWIHGRKGPGEAPRPVGKEFDQLPEWNQTEMFYVTSMAWKTRGQKYHGYMDDILFIGFGIEDQETAGIDVVAHDLLKDMGLCSMV